MPHQRDSPSLRRRAPAARALSNGHLPWVTPCNRTPPSSGAAEVTRTTAKYAAVGGSAMYAAETRKRHDRQVEKNERSRVSTRMASYQVLFSPFVVYSIFLADRSRIHDRCRSVLATLDVPGTCKRSVQRVGTITEYVYDSHGSYACGSHRRCA